MSTPLGQNPSVVSNAILHEPQSNMALRSLVDARRGFAGTLESLVLGLCLVRLR